MLCLVALLVATAPAAPADSAPGLEVNGTLYGWDRIGRFVLPGETLHLRLAGGGAGCGWVAAFGEIVNGTARSADWVAPAEPGLYSLLAVGGEQTRTVNAFVMLPFDSLVDGRLRGVRLGRYPSGGPFERLGRPRGFVEVTPENESTSVSPRYTLGEFAINQSGGYPKYIAIREAIVLKLELLTDLVAAKGYGDRKLRIISGYRTPVRQRRTSGHRQSAHMFGAAVDVFVDADTNRLMDDLNGDREVNRKDAQLMATWVDELEAEHPELVGGCGWYRRRSSRGPFIHIDVRGERARWHQ